MASPSRATSSSRTCCGATSRTTTAYGYIRGSAMLHRSTMRRGRSEPTACLQNRGNIPTSWKAHEGDGRREAKNLVVRRRRPRGAGKRRKMKELGLYEHVLIRRSEGGKWKRIDAK